MNSITVTVQSCGGDKSKFRFGISCKDSHLFIKKEVVKFKIDGRTFISKTTCGQWYINEKGELIFTKGFDLYSKDISEHIINMKYNDYKFGKPTKVLIELI